MQLIEKSIIFFSFLILIVTVTQAQNSFQSGGYSKYLFSTSKHPQLNERLYDHILHSRLNTKYFFDDSFSLTGEVRFRTFFGNSLNKFPDFSELIKSNQPLLDMDWFVWKNENSIGYAEIDRLYFDYNANNFHITIGRQRIAWGTSWVWNPTDFFNPLSILDFDYEELPSNDGLRIQYYTGAVSKVEFVIAPSRKKDQLTAAALISNNAFDYDFNLIAGIKNNRWVTGFSWVGDVSGAGFRGEVTLQQKPKRIYEYELLYLQFEQQPISYSDKNIFSFVLSGDYTFPNSFYIHTEILFNNIGVKQFSGIFTKEASEIGMLSPSKLSVFQEFSYNISPLVRASLFGIINPDDKSNVLVPSVSYSILTNLDFYLIALIFNGDKFTQYGDYGTSVFARVKYSF